MRSKKKRSQNSEEERRRDSGKKKKRLVSRNFTFCACGSEGRVWLNLFVCFSRIINEISIGSLLRKKRKGWLQIRRLLPLPVKKTLRVPLGLGSVLPISRPSSPRHQVETKTVDYALLWPKPLTIWAFQRWRLKLWSSGSKWWKTVSGIVMNVGAPLGFVCQHARVVKRCSTAVNLVN